MAVNRVLTSYEKFALQSNSRFQALCKQAILDKAFVVLISNFGKNIAY